MEYYKKQLEKIISGANKNLPITVKFYSDQNESNYLTLNKDSIKEIKKLFKIIV